MAKLTFTAGEFQLTTPPEAHFAFNPWRFDFLRTGGTQIIAGLSFGGDDRELRDGAVRFDLSRWVRSLFEGTVAERLAAADYTQLLPGDGITAAVFTTPVATAYNSLSETVLEGDYRTERVAVWGGAERGETLGGDETLRWWYNCPFTVDMLTTPEHQNGATFEPAFGTPVFTEYGTGGQLFNPLAFWESSPLYSGQDIGSYASVRILFCNQVRLCGQDLTLETRTVTLVPDCAAAGARGKAYLRWIDSMGRIRYWLFTELSVTDQVSADEQWSVPERPEPEVYDGAVSDAQAQRQSLTLVRTRTLAAASLSDDEYAVVGTVARSPVIDEFDGYGSGGNALWHRLAVVAGSAQRDRSRLQDFQFTVTDRTQTTQQL